MPALKGPLELTAAQLASPIGQLARRLEEAADILEDEACGKHTTHVQFTCLRAASALVSAAARLTFTALDAGAQ
jgi:hypothetical protein